MLYTASSLLAGRSGYRNRTTTTTTTIIIIIIIVDIPSADMEYPSKLLQVLESAGRRSKMDRLNGSQHFKPNS